MLQLHSVVEGYSFHDLWKKQHSVTACSSLAEGFFFYQLRKKCYFFHNLWKKYHPVTACSRVILLPQSMEETWSLPQFVEEITYYFFVEELSSVTACSRVLFLQQFRKKIDSFESSTICEFSGRNNTQLQHVVLFLPQFMEEILFLLYFVEEIAVTTHCFGLFVEITLSHSIIAVAQSYRIASKIYGRNVSTIWFLPQFVEEITLSYSV